MPQVIIDTSVLVGSLDARDVLHARAVAVMDALESTGLECLLLDCVVIETVGVICRRRGERRAATDLPDFSTTFPTASVTRAYPLLEESWHDILSEVVESEGRLNAHDALILALARREKIPFIASFDADLAGHGVGVLSRAEDVAAVARGVAP